MSTLTARFRRWRLRLETELRAQGHDPLVLEQFHGAGTLVRITLKALHQEVDALFAELVAAGELWRISLGDVVHNGPFVVHGCPWASTSSHLKDDAPERPDVHSTMATSAATLDDFGRHVHGSTGHGLLTALARGGVFGGEGLALLGNDFGGAKVDKLDDTVVVEENV